MPYIVFGSYDLSYKFYCIYFATKIKDTDQKGVDIRFYKLYNADCGAKIVTEYSRMVSVLKEGAKRMFAIMSLSKCKRTKLWKLSKSLKSAVFCDAHNDVCKCFSCGSAQG